MYHTEECDEPCHLPGGVDVEWTASPPHIFFFLLDGDGDLDLLMVENKGRRSSSSEMQMVALIGSEIKIWDSSDITIEIISRDPTRSFVIGNVFLGRRGGG